MYVICNNNQYNVILQTQEMKQFGLQHQQLYGNTTLPIQFPCHYNSFYAPQ